MKIEENVKLEVVGVRFVECCYSVKFRVCVF